MTENQIKVNNIEELISKAQEYVASQGGPEKVSLGKTATVSDTYTYVKGKTVPTKKGGIEVNLNGQNGSSVEFFWELEKQEEEKGTFMGKLSPKLVGKVLTELKKVIPDKNPNKKDSPQSHSLSIVAIPCSSLKEVKEQINKYYQENKAAITQNPDFSRWIDITETGLYTNYSEVDKNGKTTYEGPYNTATIILRRQYRKENEKIVNEQISLLLKVKTDSEEWLKEDFEVLWPEKQLKDYWNSLVGKKESNSNSNKYCSQCGGKIAEEYWGIGSGEKEKIFCSQECMKKAPKDQKDNPKNSDKNNQSEIEKLCQEIKELEKKLSTDNSENTKKELAEKRKRFNELGKNKGNDIVSTKSDSNLAVYLSLGGIALLIGLFFLVRLVRKKLK